MALTKHSLYSVLTLGIPTVEYLELDDISQFEDGKMYNIGILEARDLKYSKECFGLSECEKFTNELRRIHGRDSRVFFYEAKQGDPVCGFRINAKGDYDFEKDSLSDTEVKEIYRWFKLLEKNYDFSNPIFGVISRDPDGNLFISSIE